MYAQGSIVSGAGPVIGGRGNVRLAVGWPMAAADAVGTGCEELAGGAVALLCVDAS